MAALADGGEESEEQVPPWLLHGHTLLARHGTTLPDICLFTGEATTRGQRLRYPLSWTSIWFKIMAVFFAGLAVVSYTHFRRTSNVDLAMGSAGRRRHRVFLGLYVAAVAAGFGMALAVDVRELSLAGLLGLCFVGLVVAARLTRTFAVVKIDRQYAHLRLRPVVAAVFARLPRPAPAPRVWWRP